MTTPTHLYLLYHPVFLLTVVLPQSLCVLRDGRSLPLPGSVPSSGDGPYYTETHAHVLKYTDTKAHRQTDTQTQTHRHTSIYTDKD